MKDFNQALSQDMESNRAGNFFFVNEESKALTECRPFYELMKKGVFSFVFN